MKRFFILLALTTSLLGATFVEAQIPDNKDAQPP